MCSGKAVDAQSGELNYELRYPRTKWPPGVPSSALGVQPLPRVTTSTILEPLSSQRGGERNERQLCALEDALGVQDQREGREAPLFSVFY